MDCVNPILLTKDVNQLLYPLGLEVPCGKCILCRIRKRNEWTIRCTHELDYHETSSFVTLTYDDENLPIKNILPTLVKTDLQKFIKRLRKTIHPKKLRYFAAGEYGDITGRPHYHLILFGLGLKHQDKEQIKNAWHNGFTDHKSIIRERIQYVCKYIEKQLDGDEAKIYTQNNIEKPFRLLSKGIGKKYADQYKDQIQEDCCIKYQGKEHTIPRYYVKRLDIDLTKARQKVEELEKKEHFKKIGSLVTKKDVAINGNNSDNTKLNTMTLKERHQKRLNVTAKIALRKQKL